MRPVLALPPCDKFLQNRTESHSHHARAAFDCPCGDVLASVATLRRARRAICSGRLWSAAGRVPAGSSRDRDARRAGMGAGLHPSDLRQSASAKRRAPDARRARHLRLPQPVHRERAAGRQYARLHRREPARARLRRAVHALRTAGRPVETDAARSYVSSTSIRPRVLPTASR